MHIVLHPTHITSMQPGGRPPRVDKLQKVRALAFPMDQVLIMQAGDTPHCEVTLIGNLSMSWICAELWGDVLAALEQGRGSGSIARVPLTDAIVEGIKAEPTLAELMAADLRRGSFKDNKPQEGTRSNPIRPTLRKPDAQEIDPEYGMKPDDLKEIMEEMNADAAKQAEGVTLPLPASSREVQPGDLRIVEGHDGWEIEVAYEFEDPNTGKVLDWGAGRGEDGGLPSELRRAFKNFADAAKAIRIAGYARRLIDEEPGAA